MTKPSLNTSISRLLGDLQTVCHAIKVLGTPPGHFPEIYVFSLAALEREAAAISQSPNGFVPLILAEVAVKGPVLSTKSLATSFANIRIATFSPPNRLSNGSLAWSIIVTDPSGKELIKSSNHLLKILN